MAIVNCPLSIVEKGVIMLDHRIFNERPESQDRLIKFLERMGYEYVSRSEAEKKRGRLNKVLFEDELARFLNKQNYTFKSREYLFTPDAITKAINAINEVASHTSDESGSIQSISQKIEVNAANLLKHIEFFKL